MVTHVSTRPLLSVRDLRLEFDTFDGVYRAIDGVSFDLAPGESLGIVGETGCGKSVTAKSILGLVPSPPARIVSGRIVYAGEDLVAAGENRLRALRGMEIAMIFQDPMTYLNPVFTIGQQLVDVITAHQRVRPEGERLGRREAREHALDMLRRVHLPNPERQMSAYPYQLSGGMRQRVLIAQALSGNPRLLVADEPTTALDVTIQAQILDLIAELMEDLNLSVIMISHDLGVVASLCRRVIVMYAGQVVEDAQVERLFSSPRASVHAGAAERGADIPAGGRRRSPAFPERSPICMTRRRDAASRTAAPTPCRAALKVRLWSSSRRGSASPVSCTRRPVTCGRWTSQRVVPRAVSDSARAGPFSQGWPRAGRIVGGDRA